MFPPETDISCIADSVAETLPSSGGFTVRFSHDTEMGLPRCFLQDRDEIAGWVQNCRRRKWTTIIHHHISVRHSFELLLADSFMLLEHIPGMWESDNVLDPDVAIVDDEQVRIWRCARSRPARFAQPDGWHESSVMPLTQSELGDWVTRLGPVVSQLREDFAGTFPLNFHFVEDDKGRWFFLNIRPGFDLDIPVIDQRPPHVVSGASDLDSWDGKSTILLRFSSARGAERRIFSIAERLPKHGPVCALG